jgi:group I intron endonuclease
MGNYKRNEENKKDSNQCGIYSITNKLNGKRYIGQTYNFKYRWMRHRSYLKHNTEHNAHLQNAWNKYGAENFEFEIIERCKFEQLDEREIYWINYYDSKNAGYNFADGGLGCKGYKHTDEEIAKMRMIQNPEPIVMLDLNGEYIRTFVSAGEACDFLSKKSTSGIKRCCEKDKYKKAYGYIWIYEKDYKSGNIDWNYYLSKNKNLPKPVLQYNFNMELIKEYASAYDTSRKGFNSATVSAACNGKYDTYKGYIWIWKDNPEIYYKNKAKRKEKALNNKKSRERIILQYSKEMEYLKEWTYDEILNNNFNLRAIQSNCSGHTKTSQGYIWRYKSEESVA